MRKPWKKKTAARGAWIALLGVVFALAGPARADEAQLRQEATVDGSVVTLADVAKLEGEQAQRFASLEVARFSDPGESLTVSLSRVRRALEEAGAHWGRLSLRGFSACRVVRPEPAPAAANPSRPLGVDPSRTLRAAAERFLTSKMPGETEGLSIAFADGDAEALRQDVSGLRLEFEPLGNPGLGRVPLIVRRYRGQTPVGTERLTAAVSRQARVVVAVRQVSRGEVIGPSDVALRSVALDREIEPTSELEQVVGKVAAGLLRDGQTIGQGDVADPLLVERGQLIEVRFVARGLVVATTVRALEDGAQDQVIAVRNERSRKTFSARVVAPGQAVETREDPQ